MLQRLHGHLAPRAVDVQRFLAAPNGFAVVGASAERQKFGNQVESFTK